ncbi:polyamine aminopropyltransferase [Paenibacillus sp. J2TS4]|uniref:polyamine aminopropyltransferase n=1 Tax=Paenibacillus sp. J2TS4 TaxID=2807194 RepID=UPI001B29B451|nr:polyamine aminopropyltransferase [Paenibacillus sp. J2TS4]GIP31942.1 spermidine synthase [Paenibacillus sp. J2TS4]
MERLSMYLHRDKGGLWLTENERDNLKINYRIKEVVFEQKSRFQHVMILDSYDFGRMLVLDGAVQTTSMDGHIYNEMIVHAPLTLHPDPRKVLIIGGGDCGAAREACKYRKVEQIDMVEIDESVVVASKAHLPEVSGNLSDPRVNFIYADGVDYAKKVQGEYDVIIVDSSDPVGPAKQLFELSFYQSLHRALKEDGIMVCQSQSPIFQPEIMSETYSRIDSLFLQSHLYWAVVPTYPGGMWSFTLGSKRPVDFSRIAAFDKQTVYTNKDALTGCFQLPQFVKALLEEKKSIHI